MDNLSVERTPSNIAAEILTIRQQSGKILLISAIEIGKRLKEAKALIPHGEWGKWLAESVDYSQRTADKLMQLFKEYGPKLLIPADGDDNSNSPREANLTYNSALILLGIPEEEREQFFLEHDIGSMSSQKLQQAVKEKKQALPNQDEANKKSDPTLPEKADQPKEPDKTLQQLREPDNPPQQPMDPDKANTTDAPSVRKIAEVEFAIRRDNMINAYDELLKMLVALAETDPKLKEEFRETAHRILENMTKRLIVYPPTITTNLKIKKTVTTL